MGIRASYMMIDDSLEELLESDSQMLENMSSAEFKTAEIDKAWDMVHFVLTGNSASDPIEGDPLSESIVGAHPHIVNDEAYVAYTRVEELSNIISALELFNIDEIQETFDPEELKMAQLYPSELWEEDADELIEEITDVIILLTDFYKEAKEKNLHVVITFV